MFTKGNILITFIILIIFIGASIVKPVPKDDRLIEIEGKLISVEKSGTNDIGFRLADSDQYFYINRGLERGLSFNKVSRELIGQEVRLKYPIYWTPLDPLNRTKHIVELESNGRIIYSELLSSR